jgi:hypothetical protein
MAKFEAAIQLRTLPTDSGVKSYTGVDEKYALVGKSCCQQLCSPYFCIRFVNNHGERGAKPLSMYIVYSMCGHHAYGNSLNSYLCNGGSECT